MKNSIPTLDLGLEPAEEGRSVGSFRPKIFFAALRAAVGRSVFTESETQKSHFLSRSVGDAELTFNFAPPIALCTPQRTRPLSSLPSSMTVIFNTS